MKIRVVVAMLSISLVVLAVAGCKNNAASTGVPAISVQPMAQTITIGQTATFTITASGTGALTYQWWKNGLSIAGANTPSYTTPAAVSTDNNAFFFCYVSNSLGSTESNVVILTVNAATSSITAHNDNAQSALNSNESILTPANVGTTAFGKTGFFGVEGAVSAQPLYLSEVNVPGKGVHNVLYVSTENDSMFAFDAYTGTILWRASMAGPGETPGDNTPCDSDSASAGISATPVIDRTRGLNGAIYVVAKSRDAAGVTYERLHALDAATGTELFGGPTTIPVAISGGSPAFEAAELKAQGGLVAANGHVYASWGSLCKQPSTDAGIPTPIANSRWVVAFDGGNLAISKSENSSENGEAILAADSRGDVFPANLVLPDATGSSGKVWHLALKAGADGSVYLVDRDAESTASMTATSELNAGVIQKIDGAAGMQFAYFNNTVYVSVPGKGVRAFPMSNARLSSTPSSETGRLAGLGDASISVSSHGAENGIIWVLENGTGGVLHAYDAADLSREIFNSTRVENGPDFLGWGNSSIMPLVVNGHVYVVTTKGVAVFSLLK